MSNNYTVSHGGSRRKYMEEPLPDPQKEAIWFLPPQMEQ